MDSSSLNLKKYYNIPFSSPTIRNELKVLEDCGFLEKKFFSSGRLPTLKAINFYIETNIIKKKSKNRKQELKMEGELQELAKEFIDFEDFIKNISEFLQTVTLAFNDEIFEFYGLKHIFKIFEDSKIPKDKEDHVERLLNYLDDDLLMKEELRQYSQKELPKILIGGKSKISDYLDCSITVSQINFHKQIFGIAFIDNTRSNYKKNYTLAKVIKNIKF